MRYLAAYALLALAGNAAPSVADVTAVITSVGGAVDAEKLNAIHAKVAGKNITELIANGTKLLGTIGGSSAAAPAAAAPAKKEEAKKVVVVEEPKEEEFEGAGDLFDF